MTTAAGTLNIGGGVVNIGSVTIAQSDAGGAVSGTLNITGGAVTLAGDITTTAAGTGTITLAGGVLNMGTHNIGASGNVIDAFNFNSGTLQDIGTNYGTVTLGGAAIFNQTGSSVGTLSGVVTGAGSLTKTGSGSLVLTAANTYTGGTTITTGTMLVGTGGVLANTATGTVTVNSGGTLTLGRSDVFGSHATAGTTPLVINAGGVVNNNGAFFNALGPVTLNGGFINGVGGASGTFTAFALKGTVTASAGNTSTIASSGTNAGIHLGDSTVLGTTFNVANNGTLVVSGALQDGRDTASPYPAHTSFLTKTGAGVMTLTGTSTFSGATTINGGSLLVNGRLNGTGTVTVNGGLLGGSGVVAGLITVDTGTLSPGNSVGTLTAQRSVTLNSGAVFMVELTNTQADQLLMAGSSDTLTLNNPTLTLSPSGPAPSAGTVYTIIAGYTTLNKITGFNGGASTVSDGTTDYTIGYGATDITLTAIPEPFAAGLLLLGLGALLFRRRRNDK